jgi:hypothetical protein
MDITAIKYQPVNTPFVQNYTPGSLRVYPKTLYKYGVYGPSGTHGIREIQDYQQQKTRNVGGYTMQNGVPAYVHKKPRGYSVRELKQIQRTPVGGSIPRVVANENTEYTPFYDSVYRNPQNDLIMRKEVLNGRERLVPIADFVRRRAPIGNVDDNEDLNDEFKPSTTDELVNKLNAFNVDSEPSVMSEETQESSIYQMDATMGIIDTADAIIKQDKFMLDADTIPTLVATLKERKEFYEKNIQKIMKKRGRLLSKKTQNDYDKLQITNLDNQLKYNGTELEMTNRLLQTYESQMK